MSAPSDWGAPLPENLEPIGVVSVCIDIPDAPEYRQAFWGQLWQLGNAWFWEQQNRADERRQVAAQLWRNTLSPAMDRYLNGEQCGGDMDCCDDILAAIAALQIGQSSLAADNLVAKYDGTPGSVNPKSPGYNFDLGIPGDETDLMVRDAALCLAAERIVWETMVAMRTRAAIASGLAIVGGGFAALLPIIGIPITVAIAYVAGRGYELVSDAMADSEAMDAIICRLYRRLKGRPVSESEFIGAVVGIPSENPNEQLISNVISELQYQQSNYLHFVNLLGAAADLINAGEQSECCDPEPCEYYWDFTEGIHNWSVLEGQYMAGQGLRAVDYISGPNFVRGQAQVVFDEPCTARYFCIHASLPISSQNWTAITFYWLIETTPGVWGWTASGSTNAANGSAHPQYGGHVYRENIVTRYESHDQPFKGVRLMYRGQLNSQNTDIYIKSFQLKPDAIEPCEDVP